MSVPPRDANAIETMSGDRRSPRPLRRALVVCVSTLVAFVTTFPPLYALFVPERLPARVSLPSIADRAYQVAVVDWGYHTAVIVEQPKEWQLGPPGVEAAPFVEYAWGDRRFYLESDFRPHALFATLFLPTESVLYVQGRRELPREGGPERIVVRTVSAKTLHELVANLERYARHDSAGTRLAPFAPTAGYRGRFYPAHGRYLWSRDCNWWTVAQLARAGLADDAAGVLFTPQVFARLRGF